MVGALDHLCIPLMVCPGFTLTRLVGLHTTEVMKSVVANVAKKNGEKKAEECQI
jgi:hypothetical protein